MLSLDLLIAVGKNVDIAADVVDLQQARFHSIIKVCSEIRDLVGEVDNLRLQGRPSSEQVAGKIGVLVGAVVARMLDDPLAHAERKVQSAVVRVTLLEVLNDAQRMEVVVEAQTVAFEALIQCTFARVAERRVADVVDQRQRLREILVQPQRLGNAARDLHDFDGVGETAAEVIGSAAGEYLRLPCEAAKGACLHDTFAIALKRRTRRAFWRGIHALHQQSVRVA